MSLGIEVIYPYIADLTFSKVVYNQMTPKIIHLH